MLTVTLYLIVLLFILLIYYHLENFFHQKRVGHIPIRIHVNGTRGKSSIARLIAAALRKNGIETCAKTTGTDARIIYPNGDEEPLFRIGFTNIIEQIEVFKWAYKNKAEAIVIECMALQPILQSLCEIKIVKSTHSVMTNAREDHLDVMGPTKKDVALALAGTAPVKGKYFVNDEDNLDIFNYAAKDRGSIIYSLEQNDIRQVTNEEINQFKYLEFKENVALALKVCESLGLDRKKSLKGMQEATPDPGALIEYKFKYNNSSIIFANAFAANDPFSTKILWDNLSSRYDNLFKVLIVNCREDRQDRSKQLAESIVDWKNIDKLIAIGTGTKYFRYFYEQSVKSLDKSKAIIKSFENENVERIFDNILIDQNEYLLVGVGNIKGVGMETIDFCENKVT